MGRSLTFYVLAILAALFASAWNVPKISAQEVDNAPTEPVLVGGIYGGCRADQMPAPKRAFMLTDDGRRFVSEVKAKAGLKFWPRRRSTKHNREMDCVRPAG